MNAVQKVISVEDGRHLDVYQKLPIVIDRGEDVWVYGADGTRYLDLYGGHAVCVTGHCHPRVVRAVAEQARRLIFFSNAFYVESRSRALDALAEIAPAGLDRIFLVNSGAEAVENALKVARKATGRPEIISFEGGFHGRTAGALSATGLGRYRDAFPPHVPGHSFAAFGDLDSVRALISESTAAVLLEPIQSMAGVRTASGPFFSGLRELCSRHGALLIYDEIQTGMGRTGDYFFAGSHSVLPDLIVLAKGLASGLPAGAILMGESLARQMGKGDLGSTFGGGPIVCAAIEATVAAIREDGMLDNVRSQSRYLFDQLSEVPGIEEVTGAGFLVGLRCQEGAAVVSKRLLERRILTGLSNDPAVLRLLPPLTLQQKEIDQFIEALQI